MVLAGHVLSSMLFEEGVVAVIWSLPEEQPVDWLHEDFAKDLAVSVSTVRTRTECFVGVADGSIQRRNQGVSQLINGQHDLNQVLAEQVKNFLHFLYPKINIYHLKSMRPF